MAAALNAPAADTAPPPTWHQAPWGPGPLNLSGLPPLGLYIHLPWCLAKCPYCDFNSHARAQGLDAATEARYLQALRLDLEAALPWIWGRRLHSVFIGGGTPSLFSPEGIAALLDGVRSLLNTPAGTEVTLEANPGTFERERFRAFAAAGVNRLSVGVQSFDDAQLRVLGRVHDARQAHAALEEVAQHFPRFNIDLMVALPGQSPAAALAELRSALAHAPPHLSLYQLTMEPNTRFARQPPAGLLDEDATADVLDAVAAAAEAAGLQRYEVSAYARGEAQQCQHNLNYWRFGDYLGIGAGAHSKLSFAHRIVRQVRFREPEQYMQAAEAGAAVSNQHAVARRDLPFEFMLNALRLREGFRWADFTERTGLPGSAIEAKVAQAVARGLLEDNGALDPRARQVRATPRGFDLLNTLQQMFLPPTVAEGTAGEGPAAEGPATEGPGATA